MNNPDFSLCKHHQLHYSRQAVVTVVELLNCVSNSFGTPWTVAHQAPLSMEFFRQEYWSGLPCPPPGDLPEPGTEPAAPALQTESLPLSHWGSPFLTIKRLAYTNGVQTQVVIRITRNSFLLFILLCFGFYGIRVSHHRALGLFIFLNFFL